MKNDTITISSSKGTKKIQKHKIMLCRQYMVGTLVELSDGNHYLLKEKVSELSKFLDAPCFFTISKRELINLEYMEAVFADQVLMLNGKSLKLDPRRKQALVRKIQEEAWI